MTTLVAALRAVERGDPFAMRKAVDAIGVALEILSENASAMPAAAPAVSKSKR